MQIRSMIKYIGGQLERDYLSLKLNDDGRVEDAKTDLLTPTHSIPKAPTQELLDPTFPIFFSLSAFLPAWST